MWRLAADGGSHAAMEAVAIVSLHGKLPRFDRCMDLDEARRLYASAVEARYVRSALSLGLMHPTGEGGPQNLAEARRLFVLGFEIAKVEAEADPVLLSLDVNPWADAEGNLFPSCQYNLGVMLCQGTGGPSDMDAGMEQITLAADVRNG